MKERDNFGEISLDGEMLKCDISGSYGGDCLLGCGPVSGRSSPMSYTYWLLPSSGPFA